MPARPSSPCQATGAITLASSFFGALTRVETGKARIWSGRCCSAGGSRAESRVRTPAPSPRANSSSISAGRRDARGRTIRRSRAELARADRFMSDSKDGRASSRPAPAARMGPVTWLAAARPAIACFPDNVRYGPESYANSPAIGDGLREAMRLVHLVMTVGPASSSAATRLQVAPVSMVPCILSYTPPTKDERTRRSLVVRTAESRRSIRPVLDLLPRLLCGRRQSVHVLQK